MGNVVDNRNRGIFAEWLVGQVLHAIDAREFRQEWDVWDLQYRGAGIEVKTSGLNQYWSPLRRSRPSFGISVPKQIWCEQTAQWQANDQAARPARVYVFCLHTSLPATNASVACPNTWEFWGDFGSNARQRTRRAEDRRVRNAGPPRSTTHQMGPDQRSGGSPSRLAPTPGLPVAEYWAPTASGESV